MWGHFAECVSCGFWFSQAEIAESHNMHSLCQEEGLAVLLGKKRKNIEVAGGKTHLTGLLAGALKSAVA